MRILVTGGSGYIGSHVARALVSAGHHVVILDRQGRDAAFAAIAEAAPVTAPAEVVTQLRLDVREAGAALELERALRDHQIDAVVNLAGSKDRAAAAARPLRHIDDHLRATTAVLTAMHAAGVERLVHSSTAAVYGDADGALRESAAPAPTSAYGHAALVSEWLVRAQTRVTELTAIVLRHFTVLGSGHPALIDRGSQTIVPMVLAELEAGRAPRIHGDDFATADGTCVRDVVHVDDVAQAHLSALASLSSDAPRWAVYNVGTGTGASVRELVEGVRARWRGAPAAVTVARRPGDVAVAVADTALITELLGWRPRRGLDDMLDSAVGPVLT